MVGEIGFRQNNIRLAKHDNPIYDTIRASHEKNI